MGFDPAALAAMPLSFDDESAIIELSESEIRRIQDGELRRRCGGLKLASRIVAIAAGTRTQVDDQTVIETMREFLHRLGTLRRAVMGVLGIKPEPADFAAVFGAVTDATVDILIEEWRWSHLAAGGARRLSPAVIAKLLDGVIEARPERFDAPDGSTGLALASARRLCLLEAIPRLYGLTNHFDYYQSDVDAMVARLLAEIVEQAEIYAERMAPTGSPDVVERTVIQRMYGVATGMLCEVYKATAYRDVQQLRSMSDLDRGIVVAQYERHGMPYGHIATAFRGLMARVSELTKLVLESQGTAARREGA